VTQSVEQVGQSRLENPPSLQGCRWRRQQLRIDINWLLMRLNQQHIN